jgi:hypothetical protein
MLAHLTEENIKKIFPVMGLEDKTLLISMIRQGIRKNLEAPLNEEMKNELFYYEYFSKMENT